MIAPGHEHVPVVSTGLPVAIELLILVGVTVVVGFALLEPFAPMSERWVRPLVAVSAAGVAVGEVWARSHNPLGLLAAAVALAAAVHGRDNVTGRLAAPICVAAAAVAAALLATGEPEAILGGIAVGAVSLAWFAAYRGVAGRPAALRVTAAGVAFVVLSGLAWTVVTEPGSPPRGVPVIATGGAERVLVVPQRAGWNLVQATDGITAIGSAPGLLLPAKPRPGAGGVWATVELPPGASTLWVSRRGRLTAIPVDTGSAPVPAVPSGLAGPDGPECAQAIAAVIVADGKAGPCPATRLAGQDAAALRATIDFLAARGEKELTLAWDDSPRASAAAGVVRAAAARSGMTVAAAAPARPLVLVAGWERAESLLHAVAAGSVPAAGVYLAPWLLSPPLLDIPAGQLVALGYDPAAANPRRYARALADRFPAAKPCASGYRAWLADKAGDRTFRIYAISTVDLAVLNGGAAHHAPATGWFPGGAITAVSGPLTPRRTGRRVAGRTRSRRAANGCG